MRMDTRDKKRLENFPATIRGRTPSLKPEFSLKFFKERIEKVDKQR